MYLFLGNKVKPTFLLDYNKKNKNLTIYTPDKYSKNEEDFLEKYTLGKIVMESKIKNIIFNQGIPKKYKKESYNAKYTCELIVNTGKEYFFVCDKIEKIKTI